MSNITPIHPSVTPISSLSDDALNKALVDCLHANPQEYLSQLKQQYLLMPPRMQTQFKKWLYLTQKG